MNNNQNNQNMSTSAFPLGFSQITNPNWLVRDGEPHHYEVYNSGGIIRITPRWNA